MQQWEAAEIQNPEYSGPRILICLEPPGKVLSIPRIKTCRQLLAFLRLEQEEAIIARDGKLLTPDRRIWPNDRLLVRLVGSRG